MLWRKGSESKPPGQQHRNAVFPGANVVIERKWRKRAASEEGGVPVGDRDQGVMGTTSRRVGSAFSSMCARDAFRGRPKYRDPGGSAPAINDLTVAFPHPRQGAVRTDEDTVTLTRRPAAYNPDALIAGCSIPGRAPRPPAFPAPPTVSTVCGPVWAFSASCGRHSRFSRSPGHRCGGGHPRRIAPNAVAACEVRRAQSRPPRKMQP